MCSEKENEDMSATLNQLYSPYKSLEESLKEMKNMRQGKKEKRNWRKMMKDIKADMDEGKL
ncbi:hypothetical protein PY093_18830 [Cytobacillus sp. S13-E01]|uniref:hypothetical protein n=1 Tax=Cytobacillus sp. S13-E01 TaxID=3031326 RepID=UPI0023D8541B|nr:hypothetical protein [Cytobacillus sp. S13-E01]MDF0728683.1 hypothetical protein [Cytobacillus sp. S13-E01]